MNKLVSCGFYCYYIKIYINSAFTEKAICITNCIYDADIKTEDDATEV